MNQELPDVQAGFEKGEEPKIKLPTSAGLSKKQDNSRKTSASLTMLTPLCASQQTVENSKRDGNTRPPDLPHEKSVHKLGGNRTWNNRLVPNRKRSTSRLYIVTPII